MLSPSYWPRVRLWGGRGGVYPPSSCCHLPLQGKRGSRWGCPTVDSQATLSKGRAAAVGQGCPGRSLRRSWAGRQGDGGFLDLGLIILVRVLPIPPPSPQTLSSLI